MEREFDFGGYATRSGVKCSDGRVIRKDAFKHQDGEQVPLVWNHGHRDIEDVLGHALLENRDDGVYCHCKFNSTKSGMNAKILVQHGDIDSLSIFANDLTQRGSEVCHGMIKEVSLVMAGANPEARIDNVTIQHGDDYFESDEDVIIRSGLTFDETDEYILHSEEDDDDGEDSGRTIEDVVASMNEEQKSALYYLVGTLSAESMAHSNDDGEELSHSNEGDDKMKKNVFERDDEPKSEAPVLSHSQFAAIMEDAQRSKGSFRDTLLSHAKEYGIEDIELLFPDARNVTNPPDWIKRRTEWVSTVINGCRHSPFSRIKSMAADITADEARAKGYTKGNRKTEEVFKLLQRVTTPTTVYKKQKLDRDDIIDITDLDVVAWVKGEMRMMLDEEIARAVMIGDGRPAVKTDGNPNEDKINEEHIRPIWTEDDLYAPKLVVEADATLEAQMEAILRAMDDYEGSGSPTLFTYQSKITDMLLLRDKIGRRYYETEAAVANALGVDRIVKIPLMKGQTRETKDGEKRELIGIIVNLRDYTIGADRGGQVSMFDDFDIDYNQYKYLLETRFSGCLTHPKSAIIVEQKVSEALG